MTILPAWGQGRLIEAPWTKYFVLADMGTLGTEQLPLNDHCSNEYEVISCLHNHSIRADGVCIGRIKVREKGEGSLENVITKLTMI